MHRPVSGTPLDMLEVPGAATARLLARTSRKTAATMMWPLKTKKSPRLRHRRRFGDVTVLSHTAATVKWLRPTVKGHGPGLALSARRPWQLQAPNPAVLRFSSWSSWVFSWWTWKLAWAATTWRRTSATARSQKLSVMQEAEPGPTAAIPATPPPTRIILSVRSSTRGDASIPPPTAVNARCQREHAIRL